MQFDTLSNQQIAIISAIIIWDTVWKGFALWKAARGGSKGWFIALLLINSAGLLPMAYLLLKQLSTPASS